MGRSGFIKIAAISSLLALSACASDPTHINDVCAVFNQRDGWFNNWRSSAESTQAKYGVPVHVLMATVRKESGFRSDARPPRTTLLGFIPWKRQSSAYGYSQALDGTWAQYKTESGNFAARRSNFDNAVDFVGWYHARSADVLGIARDDTYRLYLAYYLGWSGYKRGGWDAGSQQLARQTDATARTYQAQLSTCR